MLVNLKGSRGAIIVDDNDIVWYSASKIAGLLGSKKKGLENVGKGDRKQLSKIKMHPKPKNISPETEYINEAGVFSWVFMSKKKVATQITDLITDIVLPEVRKNGFYDVEKKYKQDLINLNKKLHEREEMKGGYMFEEMMTTDVKTPSLFDTEDDTMWDRSAISQLSENMYTEIATPSLFTE